MIVVKKVGPSKTNNLIESELIDAFAMSINDDVDFVKIKEISPLVASIDLYSDTFIGASQKEVYISELKKIQEADIDKQLSLFCEQMILVLSGLEMPGEYIVFEGD